MSVNTVIHISCLVLYLYDNKKKIVHQKLDVRFHSIADVQTWFKLRVLIQTSRREQDVVVLNDCLFFIKTKAHTVL